ncbi:MAG: LysM peptidoglycan-binding domain-containing protein [Lentisphaeria bacterium]|nr:LysM peptidoglycan-binding domain-containing protein [Lentisphaeria bacterium]
MKMSVMKKTFGRTASLATVLCALAMLAVGCSPRIGILDSRGGIIPAPYMTPPATAGRLSPIVETPFAATPSPAVVEMPAPEEALPPPAPPVEELVLPAKPRVETLTYTVKKGDNLWDIAQMYGVTFQNIAAENNLDPEAVLTVGKTLTIPAGGRFVPLEDRPKIKATTEGGTSAKPKAGSTRKTGGIKRMAIPASGVYKVKKNESLWVIARKFGVKVADLKEANGLQTDRLQIDQELIIPKGAVKKAAAPTKTTPTTAKPADPGLAPLKLDDKPLPPLPPTVVENVEDKPKVVVDDNPPPAPLAVEKYPKKLPHTICKDETLGSIAEMYGTTIAAILQENPQIKTDADLKVNEKILVPYK